MCPIFGDLQQKFKSTKMNEFKVASRRSLLMSGSNLSLPYGMSSTNNVFEKLEISLACNTALRLILYFVCKGVSSKL